LIRDDYGVKSVPGLSSEEDVWVNLDYNSSYIGGPFFGGGRATPKIAWMAGNKTVPKIIPLIDSMDSLSSWKAKNDDMGSNVSLDLVPSKKGRAINLSYDLKKNGWVEIARDIDPVDLAELKGLNLSYLSSGGQITLEIRLEDANGTAFNLSRMIWEDRPRWTYIEILFEDLKMIQSDSSSADYKMDPARISKLKFIVHNNLVVNYEHIPGSLALDQIRGVMRVPKDSPWERAEQQKEKAEQQRQRGIALNVASWATDIAKGSSVESISRAVLLAVESLRHNETLAGYVVLRNGLALLPRSITRRDFNGLVDVAAFSPDQTNLATANETIAQIWEIQSGHVLYRLNLEGISTNSATFSPDGKKLALAGYTSASIWDVRNGSEFQRLNYTNYTDLATSLAFNPNGTMLAMACFNNKARLWDVQTGKELYRFEHNGSVYSVVFSPDGAELATASYDGTARIWDVQTGKELQKLDHDYRVESLIFSPDGTMLATGSMTRVWIWDVKTGKMLRRFQLEGSPNSITFTPDGKKLATGTYYGIAQIWDVQNGCCLYTLIQGGHDDNVNSVDFSPDGSKLATASDDTTARIWDVQTGIEQQRLSHNYAVKYVSFSPDGTELVTASGDIARRIRDNNITVQIWDISSRSGLIELNHGGYGNWVESIAFSPDGTKLAAACYDKTAQIWDAQTGQELQRLHHDHGVECAIFSPNGTRLATASADTTARIWDVQTGEELQRLSNEYSIDFAVFSPDGEKLATFLHGDNIALVWDLQSRTKLHTLDHNGRLNSLSFSPDGARIATGGGDGTVRIWDVQTGMELQMMNHSDSVNSVVFRRIPIYMHFLFIFQNTANFTFM
jgi:WD40 repeat protein